MHRTFSKLAIVGAAYIVIVGITVFITGQPASKLSRQPASQHLVGVPDDWSHHHLVFSNPGAYEQAAKDPAALAKWLTIHNDTRFVLQQMKRHAEATGGFSREVRPGGEEAVSPSGMVEPEDLSIGALRRLPGEAMPRLKPKPKPKHAPVHGYWSESLPEGSVQPNAYPAKWGASLTTASCSGDYVVYPTGAFGGTSDASIVAYNNIYDGCSGPGGPSPSIYWAYDTGGLISTSPIISEDGSQVAFVQVYTYSASLVLLKGAANSPGPRLFTGTLSSANSYASPGVTLSVGSFDPTVVGTQISDTTTPSAIPAGDTIFEYLSPSTALLAMAPSTESSDQALVISATAFRPYSLTAVDNLTYLTCTAPCMTKLAFSGSPTPNDTFSSPFYDYADDVLYVGDDNGNLHMFTPVFNGPLAEVTTSPWPVLLNAGRSVTGTLSTTSPNVTLTSPATFTQADVGATISDSNPGEYLFPEEPISTLLSSTTANLVDHPFGDVSEALTIYTRVTSPVYDPVSGNVFVGDTAGYFYAVGTGNMETTAGSITKSADLGDVIIDGPLVDPTKGMAYTFVTTNNDTTTPSNAVFQFYTTTSSSGIPCPAGTFCQGSSGNNSTYGIEVGAGGAGYYFYSGTFDNVYYQSTNTTGTLYVVGNTGGATLETPTGATLYQIPVLPNFTSTGYVIQSSTSVTNTTGITAADVGMQITDTSRPECIPANDTIAGVSGSTVTLATPTPDYCASFTDTLAITGMGARVSPLVAPLTSGSGPPWPSPLTEFCNPGAGACNTDGTKTTGGGTDYLFFSVNMGNVAATKETACTASSGNGCVLSYNISIPASISPTPSGSLNLTNVGSPGCWATGGIVIDNSDTGTAGASQVYFINLNGNNAGGPWDNYVTSGKCAVSGGAFIQAVQASQAVLQ
jgi:hypothetical protein